MQKDGEWQFVVGNDQGVLLDALCEEFFSPHSHPFERRIVIVPNASLKDFVLRHFVEHPQLQIVAGLQVLPLNQGIMEILDHFHCEQLSSEILRKRVPSFIELSLAIEELLLSPFADSQEFLPLSDYLGMEDPEQRQRRIAHLSDALAQCFVRYGLHGKAFLPVWMKEEGWQQKVWNALFSKDSPWTFPLECLEKPFTRFPGKVALFGFSFLPPVYLSFFSQISATLYHLSPCALFWADFASDRQRLSALRFFQRKGGSPKALEELDQLMQQGHPLLGNWGKLGREMLKILEAFSLSEKELYKEELPTSLLHKLQSSLLTLDESEILSEDDSLQLHTAPSKLREVEVLCDSLRTLLHSREDPIRLRDVLIACPNIGDYAPYIHLVFANSGFSYAIEGMPLLYSSDVVREWMQLLELPQKNYGLSAVLKVLRCPALMEKWGFSKGDVAELGRWFKRAEIRQGLMGNPNSWEEGLDRLLCGLAISSDVPIVEHAGITLLNRFLEIFISLRKDLALLSHCRSASEWMEFFLKLADKYFLIAWEKEPFFQELRALALSCTGLKSGQWSFESIARILKHLCEKPTGSKGAPKQEKITFVPLSQGSIRSADILWCLGMDEEAFPRSDVHSSLCEMRTLKGDYCPSRGEEDSAIFLEMLLHAKKYLIFSCQRIHPEDGKHQGPSSLVDTLNQYLIKRGVAGGLVQIDHPAFPFDPLYFSAESKIKKWSQAEFLAAQARCSPSPPLSHFLHFKPFSPMTQKEITIDIRQLKKLARNPLQLYFNETLKMYLNEEEDGEVAEFLITKVRKAMLRKHMVHTSVEQVMRQMEAQGKLPRGLFQQVAVREVAAEMEVLFKQLGKLGIKAEEMRAVRFFPRSIAERCSQPSLSLSLGDSTVVHILGTLDDVTPQGLLAHVDNDLKGLVKVWPLYLIYRCMHPENQHLLLTKKGIQTQIALEDPKAALISYLEYFLLARQRPSLLMPQFAKALLEGGEAEFTSALLKEDKDPYLNYLKRHHLCFDSEEALALWATPLQKAFSPLIKGGRDGI